MTIAVTFLPRTAPAPLPPVAFIGGGNMASAIIGGLVKQGTSADAFEVVEPFEEARQKLRPLRKLPAPCAPLPKTRCT
jgi:pyrroline-5-carboxylate reductase